MDTTQDAFLGGRLHLHQPKAGYRAGTDAVLLAAACPSGAGESVFDLGLGVGAVSLCIGARVPGVRLAGLEVQEDYADLARRNADENGIALEVIEGDASAIPPDLRARSFDHVVTNPPFFDPLKGHQNPDAGRATAHRESLTLTAWLDVALRRLAPRGSLSIIHRTERLGEILSATEDRLGAIRVLPLQSRQGREASRVIVQGIKGSGAPLTLLAPFTLHAAATHEGDHTDLTAEAEAILSGGGSLIETLSAKRRP